MTPEGRRIEIRGTVQGVGFRPFVYRLARDLGVGGRVRNAVKGVIIDAFAPLATLDAFIARLRTDMPPAAEITHLSWEGIPSEAAPEFVITKSEGEGERRPSIPPDLATCAECLAETLDPADRRHRYAFTNCTNCGPRFTIAKDVPYDRPATTMARFELCPDCRREYESVEDRRFHAQPNACPVCGPQLRLLTPAGDPVPTEDPVRTVAEAIGRGQLVAVKGLGGYHLACDATDEAVVRELRRRKRRDEKPFAVMVRDLETAHRHGRFDEASVRLLTSVQRPIVLVPRQPDSDLARAVAPGCSRVGLFLPYSPLHHLLLLGIDRPLIMTSANLSDEPLAYREDEALERLADIADLFLTHDREIENRTDDSVALVMAGQPVVVRRSRGYVPRPVPLLRPFTRPVLACGSDLKNVFCLAGGDAAFLGPHIGDLEDLETYRSYTESIERLERFVGIRPEVVAHDLHPRYFSTRYALERQGVLHVAVQHHHAHVVSAMAEHGLEGPVLGVAYDGTGYGTDGTAWGGELLLADVDGFERIATTRPIPLAGGDKAIRQVWRIALALLDDAFDGEPPLSSLALFSTVPEREIAVVRQMIARGLNSPLAHGVGRTFDGFGAFGLSRRTTSFEGQTAMAWEEVADRDEAGSYPFTLEQDGAPWQLDLRGTARAAVADQLAGYGPDTISARFHNTLVQATAEIVDRAAARWGRMPVVLTGGCFQNVRLTEGLARELGTRFDVFLHGRIPPNDGGIGLGQALVAEAVARRQ